MIADVSDPVSPARSGVEPRLLSGTQGQVLAKLELTVGPFVMKIDDRGAVDGRQLKVTVLGKTATHESEGRNPLDLPMPIDPGIATMLGDLPVAATLENWDIQFAPRDATITDPSQLPEEPYVSQCVSSGGTRRSTSSSPNSGCRDCEYGAGSMCLDPGACRQFNKEPYMGRDQKGEYRFCPGAAVLVERACTGPTAGVKGLPTPCGGTGDRGCAVCWSEPVVDGDGFGITGSGGTCTAQWCGI